MSVRALVLLLTLAPCAFGQSSISSGELHGTVTDPSGAVVQDAEVIVTDASVGLTRTVTSSDLGDYRVLLLPPGKYRVAVQRSGFAPQVVSDIPVHVGEVTSLDFKLVIGAVSQTIDVQVSPATIQTERVQQSNTIGEEFIQTLPIDRRDFLTFTLLVPGVADSIALADANDYRVVQTKSSGLSFFGGNGRGNNVTVDGGEVNDLAGGVRPTTSQEAVQEFQINRANYSAELGGANGGVINIVTKSGRNDLRGSAYSFFRDYHFDAADPFAMNWINGQLTRVRPPSNRQQYGTALGGPVKHDRAYFFFAFEGLNRDESKSVSVLNDPSIFEPTKEQETILAGLPASSAAALRSALTSSDTTRNFFYVNSGVFPYKSTDYTASIRYDHNLSDTNHFTALYNYANIDESNPNLGELRGVSRGIVTDSMDHTLAIAWTRILRPTLISEARARFSYRSSLFSTRDTFGPEININGYGFFNRDYTLPNRSFARIGEISNGWSASVGTRHLLKFGGKVLITGAASSAEVLFGGRFTFGALPGSVVSSALAGTSITALQAFNLGLPQSYQQASGDPSVGSTDPSFSLYFQDSWKFTRTLMLNYGLRYELQDRRDPVPTDKNNLAPRFGFAWTPGKEARTTIRGGYGIFYEPTYYTLDWVTNALNEIDGRRQIAQVLTTIQTPGAANASNVFKTLQNQGVITFPFPTRPINPSDVTQFGIVFTHEGPLPPLSVMFRNAQNFVNAYSQQASFGIEHGFAAGISISTNYIFARTLKIVRSREDNLLPAPIDPVLGIPVWSTPYFKKPEVLQDNVYEPTGNAFYNGFTVEATKRFRRGMTLNVNYTLSKAIDEVVDYNSDFQANDQLDLRAERALSSFDQRHKLVIYGVLRSPVGNGSGFLRALISDYTFSPVVRANSGRPFNLLVGFDLNGDRHPTTDRPLHAGRNTGIGPDFWTVDLRLARQFPADGRVKMELMAEAFNLLNRLNFQSLNNTVGNIAPPFDLKGRRDLSPSQPLGFTAAMDPRRLQFGARLHF